MYLASSLAQTASDCSGWERDPQSFGVAVAKHHLQTVMGKSLPVRRMSQVTATAWRADFPDGIAVYLTFAKIPDFVAAARWYPKPADGTRFYRYTCTPDGRLVLTERQKP